MFNHGFIIILQFVFRICKINKQEHNNYPPPLILVNYVAKHFSIGLAHWRVVGKNKSVKVRKGLATDSIAAMQIQSSLITSVYIDFQQNNGIKKLTRQLYSVMGIKSGGCAYSLRAASLIEVNVNVIIFNLMRNCAYLTGKSLHRNM